MASSKDRKCAIVEFEGQKIYKSTLVSQLNSNPFLSKDRLARVKTSLYFNNSDAYLAAAESSSTCMLGIGCDCGVYFVDDEVETVGTPTIIFNAIEKGTWYIGRVQRIRRRVGKKWGISRQPVDLLN
jgi:hypothetical protein